MQEKSFIKRNILQYLNFKGISKYQFYKDTGITRGVLDSNGGMSEDNTAKFLAYYDDVNIEWLVLNKGSMLKNDKLNDKPNDKLSPQTSEKIIANQYKELETRPRIPLNAAAGTVSIALDGITNNDVEEIPYIQAFSNYNYTILVKGDSMEPEFKSGDEIACIQLKNTTFVQWGRIHVLDTSQGIIVKRIYDNEDSILCKSENTDLYKDFSIPKEEIFNLGLVIGLIRRY